MSFPSLDLTRADLESPGAATARIRRLESAADELMTGAVRNFLAAVRRVALGERAGFTPGHAWGEWMRAMGAALDRAPAPAAAWLYAAVEDSEIPDIVYQSVRSVLDAAAERGATAAEIDAQLSAALSPDAGETFRTDPVALVAAAKRRHGADWSQLDQGGMSFMDRMKRDARTAVTGLDGLLTSNALAEQGFTRKRWVTRHDDKVRVTHAEAEGQTVELDMPFIVGGVPLSYPGDRSGPPGEVINCRCVVVGTRWRARRNF